MVSDAEFYFCDKFQGKVPLISSEAVHHLHIFIFVLAVVHVTFCVLTIIFGSAKVSILVISFVFLKRKAPACLSFLQSSSLIFQISLYRFVSGRLGRIQLLKKQVKKIRVSKTIVLLSSESRLIIKFNIILGPWYKNLLKGWILF